MILGVKFFAKNLAYPIGRISSVGVRPLSLFLVNNWYSSDTALGLAVAFLVSALTMAGTSADPHRRYYAFLYSPVPSNIGLSFYLYATCIILLLIVGSFVSFGAAAYLTNSAAFGGVVAFYFISEKLADEVLRLKLFERDLQLWGYTSFLRTLMQLGGVLGMYIIYGKDSSSISIVIILTLSNFVVFLPQLPRSLFKCGKRLRAGSIHWLVMRALRLLISNRLFWFIALTGSVVGYLDRLFSLNIDRSNLTLFTIVAMCFSLVQMSIDFFYLSARRRDFLEHRINLSTALKSRQFLFALAGGLACGFVATSLVLYFSQNAANFPLTYVLAIALLQLTLAVALLPIQILYWSISFSRIFYVDLFFLVGIFVLMIGGYFCQLTPTGYLTLLSVAVVFRLLALICFAKQVELSRKLLLYNDQLPKSITSSL